ncbi:hypothetical protein OB13_11960 [Pontibacter sp. HJ8]
MSITVTDIKIRRGLLVNQQVKEYFWTMGNLSRSCLLLLLAFLLSFAGGLGDGFCVGIPQTASVGIGEDDPRSSLSQSGQNKFKFLDRSGDSFVSPVNQLPAPNSNNILGFVNSWHSTECRIQGIATQYLLQSKAICLSLASSDIIFPFHYFW